MTASSSSSSSPPAIGRPVGPLLAQRSEMPPTPFTRAQARWLVRRDLLRSVGAYELGTNDGPYCRILHRVTKTSAGGAWCAALQQFSLFLLGGQNPLEPHAYCPDIAANAERLRILDATPELDDLVLFWHNVKGEGERFAHIGYVLEIQGPRVLTVEGNTNDDGSRDGWAQCKKSRPIGPKDRFVHWHRLIPE